MTKVGVIRKSIYIFLHPASYLLDIFVLLLLLLSFLAKNYSFQTWLAHKFTDYFQDELHTRIHIDRVEIDIFNRVLIQNLYIEDLHGDTLVYSHKMEAKLRTFSLKENYAMFSDIILHDPRIELKKYKGEKTMNFQFLADYFEDDSPDDPDKKPFRVLSNAVTLRNGHISVDNFNKRYTKHQLDVNHLDVYKLNVALSKFRNHGDTVLCMLRNFTAREKCGLNVKQLNAITKIAPDGIILDELKLKTQYSFIRSPSLRMMTATYDDFDDFENRVHLSGNFQRSLISMRDIAFFTDELYGAAHQVVVDGRVEGVLNDLKATAFSIGTSEKNYVKGDFYIRNMTHTDSMYIDAEIGEMNILTKQIARIEVKPFDGHTFLDVPSEILSLGVIKGEGKFKGKLLDFNTGFTAVTKAGTVSGNMTYKEDKVKQSFVSDIDVETGNLAVGFITGNEDLGSITSVLSIHAFGKEMNGLATYHIKGRVESVGYKNYNYQKINLDGDLSKKVFNGKFDISDPNLVMNYSGAFDLRGKIPEFDFAANIEKANLHVLKLIKRDETTSLHCAIKGDGKGNNLDNFRGKVNVQGFVLSEKGSRYPMNTIILSASEQEDGKKSLSFDSDILSADFNGLFNFSELSNSFMSVISEAVPAFFDNKTIKVRNKEEFKYQVKIKDFEYISALFVPKLKMSENILIDGKFISESDIFTLRTKGKIEKISYGNQYLVNPRIITKNNGDYLELVLESDRLVINDSVDLQNLNITTQALNNLFVNKTLWSNKTGNMGDIALNGIIKSHNAFEITVKDSSRVRIKNGLWSTVSPAFIGYDSSGLTIMDFDAMNGKQSINAYGRVSENPVDQFVTSICNFDLEAVTPLLVGNDLDLQGNLNGNLVISKVYETPDFKSNLYIDSFFVNEEWVGDVDLAGFYDEANERIIAGGKVMRKEIPDLDFIGYYYVKKKEQSLDFTVNMKDANLRLINGFLPDDISGFRGLADGKFTVTGTPKAPVFKGGLFIHDGFVKVNMLNTSYFFGNGSMSLDDGMVTLDNMVLEDVRGHAAFVNATYYHDNFKNGNLSFDISNMEKLLVLNTTEEMNPLYYGKAYASGSVSVLMYNGKIDVEVNATTDKNTKIYLPLYGDEDVSLGDFVEFVSHDTVEKPPVSLDDISLTFNLNVTPEAEINIIFDPLSGQQLKARGSGNIEMKISPAGEFTMEGPYEVEDGDYRFALKSFISKNFKVAKGSKITWYGDPYLADLDIRTIYTLQTSMFPLMPPDLANNYRKNTEVQCVMNLQNTLENPLIGFDIAVPRADDNIKSVMSSIRANEQELTTQFFTLLVVNSFITPSTGIGNNTQSSGGNLAANYTSELLANKFNSLLSKATGNVDLGFNYKPGDNISNNEIAVALSTQSKDGRLVLNTNVGVSQGNSINNNPSSIIGDFNLEYMLNQEGDVRLRAYNESNEFNLTNVQQSPYTQGVAVFYQKEFDNSRELRLWQNFLNIFRKKENDVHIKSKREERREKARKEEEEAEKEKNRKETNPGNEDN